ncbi:GHKL domain-containing protein [Lachnospiraceae bacterium WCA-9-b2]|uniref:GHKL domain-containing protein n=1 Tax=Sporofaciens musculi TaxID=2681861 RepID=A0A7X3SIG1_9FIRM|nr:GHKL domain-containing protein [Sporofaciens musculi]MXP75433.1 GHKL domain-containing protein [Sporofaciens musculi]
MANWARKFLYRIFCVLAMLVSVYLIVDFLVSGTFDYRIFTMFLLLTVVEIWGIIDWRRNYLLMQQKESELKLYKHYIRPLEELVKEIRAKQHEFDNHVNAILNMHLTVNDYEELVARQSAYITEVIRDDDSRRYLPLLRISDKVLAGFLYSKIVRAPSFIKTEVEVKSLEIISGISEHHLIEIVGTLVDNAYEACTKEMNRVVMELDSENDRLVFLIKNQLQGMKLKNIHRFFEKGYSTKTDSDRHGLGLYNAKMLIGRYHGEIVVSMEKMNGADFICMKVVV